MSDEDKIYRDLQRHLDSLPIGYPATKSGVEVRILRALFTLEEAEIATKLSLTPERLDTIHKKVAGIGISVQELEEVLGRMFLKGTISLSRKNGDKLYSNMMFVFGMWEAQLERLTKEFVEEVEEYFKEAFGEELYRAKIPGTRIIPVEESVPHSGELRIASYDNVRALVKEACDHIAVANCVCRQAKDVIGQGCKSTNLRETCLLFKETAEHHIALGIARPITAHEALHILEKAQAAGLVLQPENTEKPEFVCCCCGDCCEILTMLSKFPRPAELYASNHYSKVVPELCTGCEICVSLCQLQAIVMKDNKAVVNSARCIGCGNCVVSCPSNACKLCKKAKELVPPKDTDSLYSDILAQKMGKL